MHIAKLRRKIERSPVDPAFILTVQGEGYTFVG
jgi:DNA-binding response OmpR family regulator